jgi:copper(I)-binding protein
MMDRVDSPGDRRLGESALLEPGGSSFMKSGLNEDLAPGNRLQVALQFNVAGSAILEVQVKQPQMATKYRYLTGRSRGYP